MGKTNLPPIGKRGNPMTRVDLAKAGLVFCDPPRRCPECGGRCTLWPCVACRVRGEKQNHGAAEARSR